MHTHPHPEGPPPPGPHPPAPDEDASLACQAAAAPPFEAAGTVIRDGDERGIRGRHLVAGVLVAASVLVIWHIVSRVAVPLPYPSLVYLTAIILTASFGGPVAGLVAAALCLADLTVFLRLVDPAIPRESWTRFAVNAAILPAMALVVGLLKNRQAQAAEEANHGHAQLVDAIAGLEDAFALFDARDRLVISNAKYRAFMPLVAQAVVPGASYEDIVRVTAFSGQIAGTAGKETEWIAERLAAHRSGSATQYVQTNDGRWLRMTERTTRDGGRVALRTDITEVKESEGRYRAVVEDSAQGMMVIRKGLIVYANRSNAEMFGYADPAEMIGMPGIELVHPDDRHESLQPGSAEMRSGNPKLLRYYRGLRKDGSVFWYEPHRSDIAWQGRRAVQWTLIDVTEKREFEQELEAAREALAASEKQYRILFDTNPHPMWLYDPETYKFLAVNNMAVLTYGYSREEFLAMSIRDIRPPEDQARLDQAVHAPDRGAPLLSQGGWKHRKKDGRLIDVEISSSDVWLGNRPVRLIMALDVTKRLVAEQALKESQARLDLIFNVISDPIALFSVEPDGTFRHVAANAGVGKSLGLPSDEVLGKTLDELLPQEVADIENAVFARAVRERREVSNEHVLRRPGLPDQIWFATAIPVMDDAGVCTHVLARGIDMTEMRNAQAALSASQRLLKTVFDALPVNLVVKDTDTRHLMVNPAWCRHFGLSPEQVLGRTTLEIPGRPEAERRRTLERDLSTLSAESDVATFEGSDTTAGGRVRQVQSIRAPIRDESGKVTGLVCATVDLTELKRTEEKLRLNERLLQAVFDTIPHMLIVKDRDSRVLMVNRAWSEMHGISAEQATNRDTADLPDMPADDKRFYFEEDRALFETGEAQIAPEKLITVKGGKQIHVYSIKTALKDDAGKVVGLVGAFVDLTAVKQAEEKLRTSERLMQTVFDTVPHHVTVKDRGGRYLMVNKAWCESFGMTPQQVIHRNTREVMKRPHADVERIVEEDERVLEGEAILSPAGRELTVKTGEKHTFATVKAPLRDGNGEIVGLVSIGMDVTEQLVAQQKADLAHARLFDAVECIPAAFFMYDRDERLILWNSRVRELFPRIYTSIRQGMRFEEVLRSMALTEVAEAQGRAEAWVQERLRQFRTHPDKFEQTLTDGRFIQAYDFRISDGGTVCLRFDVTPAKKQEVQFRQSQKMEALGQLTGGVAHDFNNLLQIISTYTDFAMEGLPDSDTRLGDLKTVREAGDRAAELTRQLLAFSRKQVLKKTELNLNESVQSVAKILARTLGERIGLNVVPGENLDLVVADRGMVEQVILNLAVNARDAMSDGGRLTVATQMAELDEEFCRDLTWARPGRYVALRVTDTGTGIPPEVRDHIFEPFFTTKGLGKGTGLGLSTVFGIVQQHNGLIQLETERGRGTSFSIYWPVLENRAAAAVQDSQEAVKGGSETILVAEDEERVRSLIRRTLTQAGYHVMTAADGQEALDLFAQRHAEIDLVVLDMMMPRLGGIECYGKLLDIDLGVRTVFCSGWYSEEEEIRLIAESSIVVHKPFAPAQLLRAVRKSLDRTARGKAHARRGGR